MAIQIKLKNSVVQDSTPSTSDLPAVGEIALNANINSIGGFMRASDNTIVKIFGPGSVSTPTATTTVSGIAELATNSETTTGTATNRVVTPAGLKAVTDAERATSNSAYMTSAGGTLTGALTMPNGSNSAAAINFGDSDSGIFGGTNTVSLTAGGTTRLTADTGVSIVGTLAVTGAITSTSDLTIADKIIHAGDTNTAVRFPAGDTVSVETGGSEGLRVDSSQRLLVGTSSSRAVGGNTNKLFQIESTDATAGIAITRNSATNTASLLSFGKSRAASNGGTTIVQDNDQLGRINFSGADGTDLNSEAARIEAFVDGTPGANDMPGRLVFSTTADGAATPTTRLTIDSAGLSTFTGSINTTGNLNIGNNTSANPFTKLTFGASLFGSAEIRPTDDGTHTVGLSFYTDGTPDTTINPTERLRITSAGLVGIGTTNPSYLLDVQAASGDANMRLRSAGTGTGDDTVLRMQVAGTTQDNFIYFGDSDDSNAGQINYNHDNNFLAFTTNASEALRINSSGFVGINQVTPTCQLQVDAGSSGAGTVTHLELNHKGNDTNDAVKLNFARAGSDIGSIVLDKVSSNNTTDFIFNTRASNTVSESMRITGDGNVGLGTTSPTTNLQINTADSDKAICQFTNSDTGTAAGDGFQIGLASDETALLNMKESAAMNFKTADTTRLTIASDGKVGIGTTSPNTLLDVRDSSGTGISSRSTTTQATDTNKGLKVRNNSDTDTFNVSYKGQGYFAGKLGIGTTSPTSALHVSATGQSNGIRLIDSSNSGGAPNLEIISKRQDSNGNTGFAANIYLGKNRTDAKVSSGIILGTINFGGNHTDGSESNISYSAAIRAVASDSFDSKTDMPTDLVFCTGTAGKDRDGELAGQSNPGTERMRINSSGEVRIGNTGSIGLGTDGTLIPQVGIFKHSRDTGNNTATAMFFGANGKLFILGDGDCENTNNRYTGFSDQRLKENIVDANSQWDDIKALKVRNYNFKESTGFNTHKQIGVIAQELEASGMNGLVKDIADELYVEGDELPEGKNIGDVKEEGHKSVAYSVLYMKAIKALQEAMAKIEILETKVAALEAA